LTTFSIAQIDELWLNGTLAERRVMHGRAEERDGEIVAIDTRDDALLAESEWSMLRLRAAMPRDARVRLVARGSEATMTIEMRGISIVTTPEFAAEDAELLRSVLGQRESVNPDLNIMWHNGSAAVLLHEAVGHPMEMGLTPIALPPWLHVDCPMAMRRASFSDVPLRRMTSVVVSQKDGPYEWRSPRTNVQLVRGGAYDPLTDIVTIDVAVPQFTIRATREQIAASFLAAWGEPIRYPGVVCSREGQELVVGSYAPVVVTRGFA